MADASIQLEHDNRGQVVRLHGDWTARGLSPHFRGLQRQLRGVARAGEPRWDLQGVDRLDGTGALFLWRLWGGHMPASVAIADDDADVFATLRRTPENGAGGDATAEDESFWSPLTKPLRRRAGRLADFVALLGDLALSLGFVLTHPRRIPWREISAHVYHAGTRALGITGLVGFLIGVVLSYLSARQLRDYGASELIVDLAGIGLFRELGPLLGCMLIAGRSGSAMTAQLGAMKLTQELDAMQALGIPPSQRLLLPRVIALTAVGPLIAIWTSVLGVCGAMMVATYEVNMSPVEFMSRLQRALPVSDVLVGAQKGIFFGLAIGVIATYFGMQAKPDTRSLGKETTSSVVMSLTALLVIDAIFAALFGIGR